MGFYRQKAVDTGKGQHPDLDDNGYVRPGAFIYSDPTERDFNTRFRNDPGFASNFMDRVTAYQSGLPEYIQQSVAGQLFGEGQGAYRGIAEYQAKVAEYMAFEDGYNHPDATVVIRDHEIADMTSERFDELFDSNGRPKPGVVVERGSTSVNLDSGIDPYSWREMNSNRDLMTDTLESAIADESLRPKPRAKPPTRRKPPAVPRHPDGNVDVLAQMQAQIDELRRNGMKTVVAADPNPISPSRVADDEELTDFQRKLREKTEPTPKDLQRGGEKNYNYDPVYYMKADGSIVSLQGDPQNFQYYTVKKKFHALTDAEVRQYLSVERPRILKIQQEKASLINTIRRAVAVDPALAAGLDPSWETDHDHMTVAELRDQLAEIAGTPTSNGAKRRVMQRLPRLQDADDRAAEAESRRLLEGVETTPPRSVREAFENSIPSPSRGGRAIEVTARNFNSFT